MGRHTINKNLHLVIEDSGVKGRLKGKRHEAVKRL